MTRKTIDQRLAAGEYVSHDELRNSCPHCGNGPANPTGGLCEFCDDDDDDDGHRWRRYGDDVACVDCGHEPWMRPTPCIPSSTRKVAP